MGLFGKKPAPVVEISYDEVVTYLRDLEQPDYTKLLKVVETYRDADKKVKKILGIKDTKPTDPDDDDIAKAFLDDDDDTSAGNFLQDDQDSAASKQQRETAKKATSKKIEVKQ